MKDMYGRSVITLVIEKENIPDDAIWCVRYINESVSRGVCYLHNGDNCKRCPIHDKKSKEGIGIHNVVICREYRYEIEDSDIPTSPGIIAIIKGRMRVILEYIRGKRGV